MTGREQQRRISARHGAAVVIVYVVAAWCSASRAAESSADDVPRFRRVFAPLDQIHLWPFQNERYVPIAARDFEELAKKALATVATSVAPTKEQIVECRWQATFDGDSQLQGTAEFTLRHDGEGMQSIRLSPLSPSVANARWSPSGEVAQFGSTAEGDPLVLVERSGVLAFDWKLRTVRDASEGILIPLDTPPCAATSLSLRLPATFDVQRGDYVVEGPVSAVDGMNVWNIRSAGGRLKLRLAKRKDPALVGQQNLVRQEVAYEFSERGVEVTAQLRIDALQSPLDKIELNFDPTLTLVDARLTDRRLSWIAAPAPTGGRQKITIEFDRALQGANRTLFLKAVAPLVVGRRITLPILRTPGLFWQQAVFTLSVPSPLQLVRIDPRDCSFSSPVPLAGNRSGEAIDLQCFTPDATAELLLERMDRPVRATGVTLLKMFDEEILAELRSEVRVEFGDRFHLDAELPSKWIVDSVATVPSTALRDWALSESQQGKRILSLRFAQPLSPERPLRVTIAGRLKHHNSGDEFTRDDLRFVEFTAVENRDPIVAVRCENALKLQLHQEDESTAAISLAKLDPLRRELLGDFRADYLLDLRNSVENWRLDVEPRTLRLNAETKIAASVTSSELTERYDIQLRNPEKLPLRRVRVRLEPAKSGSIEWSLGDERRGQIIAERVKQNEGVASPDIELWDITFRRPPTGDAVLTAIRTTPWKEAVGVTLASIEDAETQEGTVSISADAVLPIEIRNRTLKPLPVDAANMPMPSAAAIAAARIRGAFRYDPAHTDDGTAPALSVVRAASSSTVPRAVVWELRYHSDYVADRRLAHRALLFLQTFAPGHVRIDVPDHYRLATIRIAGRDIEPDSRTSARIPLPDALGTLTAEVVYTTADFTAGSIKLIELAELSVDVPILRTTRDMTLPLAYDAPTDAALQSIEARNRQSTLRKLLGPLVPPEKSTTFDTPLTLGEFPLRREAIDTAPLVRMLGVVAGERAKNPVVPTWSELWVEVERRRSADQPPLRFDAPGLARVGIVASTPIAMPIVVDADPLLFGRRLLGESSLIVAQDRLGLLLTTDSNTAYERENGLRVFALPTSDTATTPQLPLSIAMWKTVPSSAWPHVDEPAPAIADLPPGQDYVLATPATTRGLWIIRREIPPTIAFAVVVIAFVIGRGWSAARRRYLLPVLAAIAAAALALPEWIGVFATSALIGLVGGIVVALILPSRRRSRSTGLGVAVEPAVVRSHSRPLVPRTAAPLLMCVASLSLLAAPTQAQVILAPPVSGTTISPPASASPGPVAPAAPLRPAVPIFIPVDAQGKPTGDRYQVPERLLQELQADAERSNSGKPSGALLRKAEYGISLARDAELSRLVVSELRAVIELSVLQAPAQISIPLGVPNDTTPASGLADGRLIDVRRSANGQSFTYEALEAGPSRLEIIFKPAAKSAPIGAGVSIAVPRLNDAVLKIALPAPLASLGVAQAADPLVWSEDKRQATVRLLPTDKLALHWNDAPIGATAGSSIDRLMWLKVRPGSVVVDYRLVIRPPAGGLKEVFLLADPRLQWLPKRNPGSLISDVEQTPITSEQATVGQRIRVEFTRPIVKEERVEVSFLLTGSTSIGRLRIPELRLAEELPGLKLFAVSVDPLLTSSVVVGAGTKGIAVPEFIKVWGPETVMPQTAFERTASEVDWALSVRPKPAKTSVRQVETLIAGRRQIEVLLEADVDVQDGLIYHHELQAPQNLEVDSIVVAEADDESAGQAGRWSRDDKGTLLVFLRAPLGGKHRLTLRGRILPSATGELSLPLLTLGKAVSMERIVRIARLPEVLVAVDKLVEITPQKVEGNELASVSARTAIVLRLDGKAPSGILKITENPRQATARLISTYVPEGAGWQYDLQTTIDVQQGLLDDISLELPPQVATPLAIVPSMPYEVLTSRESTKRRLLLRPRQAITGRFEFTVRAGLVDVRRDEPLPVVLLRRFSGVTHFFRLPKHAGANSIRWETSQLSAAELPVAGGRASSAEEFETFRVAGPRPQAVLRTMRGGNGRPYIRLAEHRVLRQSGGAYFGASSFLVEPAGASYGTLQLPPEMQILYATAGGGATTLLPAGDAAWRVNFVSDQMPHWIEVLYRRAASEETAWQGSSAVVVPRWEQLRAERTIWTISADAFDATSRIDDINGTTLERTLQERLSALDDVGTDLAADGSASALGWLAPILTRRSEVRRELAERLDVERNEALRRVWRDALDASDKKQSGLELQAKASAAAGRTPDDMTRLWNSLSFDARGATYAVIRGDSSQLDLRTVDWDQTLARRLLLLPALCAVVAFLVWLFLRADGALRFPQLYGMLAGIAWILLLRPEIVGWIILATMVGCRVHPSLRRVRERTLKLGQGLIASRGL
ncbi:MAG: hypothetical protein K8U03_19985 [Planctomycetia bacterium]|nr:hypothetical protein [Planctomycetia bacterium]